MLILGAAVCGFLLDLLLGDPEWMPHPVVLMGKIISRAEGTLRRRFPPTPGGEIAAGTILAALLPLGTLAFCGGVCFLALCIHPALCFAVQTLWCWQALAMRGLLQESAAVQRQLERENLPAARAAVGRIVGRDTDRLTAEGVIRAAVETVAENFCDGVAAPLLYMFLGGAPLALAYKAVNTMDSRVGYKNERYLYFGRPAARLDDAANYLPARTAALFWIAGAGLTGQSAAGAFRIWRRDRRCHASPNSAQTESACAGALGIQLAGPAWYFGQRYEKPTIGDALRSAEPEDIRRAGRTMAFAGGLLLAACAGIRAAVILGGI